MKLQVMYNPSLVYKLNFTFTLLFSGTQQMTRTDHQKCHTVPILKSKHSYINDVFSL